MSSSEASEESQLNETLVFVVKSDRKLSKNPKESFVYFAAGSTVTSDPTAAQIKTFEQNIKLKLSEGAHSRRMCRLVIFDCFSSFVGKSSSPVACRAVAVYRRRVTLSGWFGMGKGLRLNWQRKRGNCQGTTVVWLGPVSAQGDLILWSAQG